VLGRTAQHFDAHAPFFTALEQDPLLARVKLIAEPWTLDRTGISSAFPGDSPSGTMDSRWDTLVSGSRAASNRGNSRARRAPAIGFTMPAPALGFGQFCRRTRRFHVKRRSQLCARHNHQWREQPRRPSRRTQHQLRVEGRRTIRRLLAQRARFKRALLATSAGKARDALAAMNSDHQRGNTTRTARTTKLSWIDWATPTSRCSTSRLS